MIHVCITGMLHNTQYSQRLRWHLTGPPHPMGPVQGRSVNFSKCTHQLFSLKPKASENQLINYFITKFENKSVRTCVRAYRLATPLQYENGDQRAVRYQRGFFYTENHFLSLNKYIYDYCSKSIVIR